MKPPKPPIPVYDLYGEAHSGSVSGAIHVETLTVRAQVNAWNILAHRHATLSQFFFIGSGGGAVEIDGLRHPIAAPAIVWLPAGCVHGFAFEPETDGMVVTLADDALRAITALAPDCAETLTAPQLVTALPDAEAEAFGTLARAIGSEAAEAAPGARAAALCHVGLLLIQLSRLSIPARDTPLTGARALYREFRALVEGHFRARWSIPLYARRLGISPDRLHHACQMAAGVPPTRIVQERLMVEARRALIYTGMSVGEIAFDLGFEDAAYFSRFFTKRAGLSPAAFRANPPGLSVTSPARSG